MLLDTFLVWLSLTVTVKAEQHENYFQIEENAFHFADENAMWTGNADSVMSCSLMCGRRDDCKSANFIENQGSCSLLSTQATSHDKLSRQKGSFYLKKVCVLNNFVLLEFLIKILFYRPIPILLFIISPAGPPKLLGK